MTRTDPSLQFVSWFGTGHLICRCGETGRLLGHSFSLALENFPPIALTPLSGRPNREALATLGERFGAGFHSGVGEWVSIRLPKTFSAELANATADEVTRALKKRFPALSVSFQSQQES